MRSVLREVVVPTMPRPICLLRLHDDILGLLPFPAMCRSSAARGKSVPVGEPLRRGRFTPAPAFAPCGCRGGSITVFAGRRDAGVVERGGLENRCGGDPTQGSNPCLSATCPSESVLPIRLQPEFLVVFEGYAGEAEHWPLGQEVRKRSLRADILRTCCLRRFGDFFLSECNY